jgi:hypothetical protein
MHDEPVATSRLSGAPMFEPEEPGGGNPLRLVALVLAIGLAVGSAAGYLVGKRSVWQSGDNGVTAPETAPVAGAARAADTPGAAPASPGTTGAAPANGGSSSRPSTGASSAGKGQPALPGTGSAAGRAAAGGAGAGAKAEVTTGRLVVRSNPSRAEVVIDGTRRGVTPLSLRDLPLGSYVVRVTRSGYAPEAHRVTLTASRPSDTVIFEMARVGAAARPGERPAPPTAVPAPDAGRSVPDAAGAATGMGALYVLSRPVGARVSVDGRPVGVTPLLLQDVAPGARTVRLELAGHKPWTDTVQVAAGQRVRVAASLEEGSQE